MNNTFEERIREAYRRFFIDEIDFHKLVGEINQIYKWFRGRSTIFYLTPQMESQFYHNISKSLYKGRLK